MKRKMIKYSVILLLVLSLTTFVLVQVLGAKTKYVERAPYDKTGFVSKEDYTQDEIVIENSKYKFTLDTEDTNFELIDKTTNQTWYSTPQHDTLLIPSDARELFVLYYERKIEASKRMSINDESVQYGNYEFRVKDNTIEVLYEVGGKHNLSMVDLPRQVSSEDFNTKMLEPLQVKVQEGVLTQRQLTSLLNNYIETDGIRYLKTIASQESIDTFYKFIFEYSDYTYEDYLADAEKYGFETSQQLPYFEFAVKYTLTDNGFEVRLINESIVELEKFPIAYIDILPFFGAGNMGDEGFTVLPDGSGVYIDHNNLKYNTVAYEKRVYGTDLSIGTANEIKPQTGEKLSYPMYGYNKNGYGFINVITSGDAMSTLRAGFLTELRNGSYAHKIPYAYYRYAIRERDAFTFQSSTSSQRVTNWTVDYNTEDYVSSYQFVEKAGSTYYDMAKLYQAHLVETYLLDRIEQQEKLNVTLLGGYLQKKYFLGIPYTTVDSLTDVYGVMNIKNEIQKLGINDFTVTYSGFSNQGVKSTSYVKTHYNDQITTRKQLEKLIKDLKNENIDLFLEFSALYAATDKDLNLDHDVTKNIFNDIIYRYPYLESSKVTDKNKTISYVQNINTSNKVISNVIKTTNKLNTHSVSFTDFGNQLASNLTKKDTQFRNEVAAQQVEMIQRLADYNVQLRNPNQYLAMYADQILDLDMKGTMHPIVDYDIPFVALFLNGYFNYAGPAINIEDSKSVTWHTLKAIETGAGLQFTFTNENTTKLIKTEYNYLISTYYEYWMNDLKQVYQIIDNLNINDKVIIDHKVLNLQGSLVEVTYEGNIKIRINYETESYVVVS